MIGDSSGVAPARPNVAHRRRSRTSRDAGRAGRYRLASRSFPRSSVPSRRPALGRAPLRRSEPARFPRRMSGRRAGSRAIRCADSVEPRLTGAAGPEDFVDGICDHFRGNVVALDAHRLLYAPDHTSTTLGRLTSPKQASDLGESRRPSDGCSGRDVRHGQKFTAWKPEAQRIEVARSGNDVAFAAAAAKPDPISVHTLRHWEQGSRN
jgi:hypothetical protein